MLLFRGVKENPRTLLRVAVLVLAMRFVDVFWWIEPAFPHGGLAPFWLLDLAAFVAIGGVWMWSFIRCLKTTPLAPFHGPNECEPGGQPMPETTSRPCTTRGASGYEHRDVNVRADR